MSFINYSSREINCKIVYYGPGLCGKTTNLQFIYSKTNPDLKGKMISLATETERTLFFDFLPLALGQIRGFKTRFHLYTVPGQVFYDASRKLILKGVDGVVFVADSQIERMEANLESMDNLKINLLEQGFELEKVPFVIQYNKRDLPNAAPLEEMRRQVPEVGPRFLMGHSLGGLICIRRIQVSRGPYAGAVGYFGFSGNMDFCITIRTFVMRGKDLWVQAGAGIVADSDPSKEFEETLNKARGLRRAVELAEKGF